MVSKIKGLFTSKNENALAFFNILGPIVLNGISFFTVPIFTRMLGTENYGVVSIYTTWVQVFTIIMGIQTGGTLAVSRAYFKEDEQEKYCSSILFLSCMSSSLVTVSVIIFIKPISAFMQLSVPIVVLMLLQSFGTYVINFATLKYIYAKQAFKNFSISVIVSVLSVVISLVLIQFIPNHSDLYIGRIVGYAFPNIIIGFILVILFFTRGKTFYNKAYWKFCIPLCLPLIFHNLSQIVLAQSDKVMMQQLLNDAGAVGIYSFVFTLAHILTIIWGALNNTWVPFYYDYVKEDNIDIIKKKSKNYIILYTILCIGFILLSPEIIKVFASKEFWSGTYLVPIMSFSCYMMFLYSFPVNFEFYYKKTSIIACGTCGAALVNIIINFTLIPIWGMTGAAIATAISYLFLFIFHHIIAKFVLKQDYHYSFKQFIPGTLAVIVASVLFYFTINMWYLRWSIGVVLGLFMIFRIYRNKSIF